jgi:glycosyltransferase involved in cell wall biosynthesis
MSHPWFAPPPALIADVVAATARDAVQAISLIPLRGLGRYAEAWTRLITALPELLRSDSGAVFDAVTRVDVLSTVQELVDGDVDEPRLERAVLALWMALAGHRGLTAPLALPGPFRQRVVDAKTARLIELGDVRGVAATARGLMVLGRGGRTTIDAFVVAPLPVVGGAVLVNGALRPPDSTVADHMRRAADLVASALPAGWLERITIGSGEGVPREARLGVQAGPAELVAAALRGFVRAAAAADPPLHRRGVVIANGVQLEPADALARACGNAAALPWRADRSSAAYDLTLDLDDICAVAEPTASGAALLEVLRAVAGDQPGDRRALLVNVDADDFVYSFQFGRSVERRCAERGWRVDRLAIETGIDRDLAAELGHEIPPPIADGSETTVRSDADPAAIDAVRRFAARRYEAVIANVRPKLFYDLVENGVLATRALLWDRHLHDGLIEERARRGIDAGRLRALPIHVWSLLGQAGTELSLNLVNAGLQRGAGHAWPMDLEFFRSDAHRQPGRIFAGGDSARDWKLFIEAVRDLPLDVHLVTARRPEDLPPHVRIEARLPLARFRDAMAGAAICAIPLVREIAAGVTVLPMAMALGVAVVATRTGWIEQYVAHEEEALLVPAGDAGAFRNALLRLHGNPELRARLVANAHRRVTELCDLEAFTREMFAALDAL